MAKPMTIRKFDRMLKTRSLIELGLALFLTLPTLYYHFMIRTQVKEALGEAPDDYGADIARMLLEVTDQLLYFLMPLICLCVFMAGFDFYALLKARRNLNIQEIEPA